MVEKPLITSAMLLLNSARLWHAKNRDDLAELALHKILLSQPDQADALMMLAELLWYQHQEEKFRKLYAHVQLVAPHSAACTQLNEFVRIQTKEKQRLIHIELLADSGNYHAGALAMLQLFPNGPPEGELALHYYQVLGKDPQFWNQAISGIQQLVHTIPGDPLYRTELAELLLRRDATRLHGVNLIADLVLSGQIEFTRGQILWRKGVLDLNAVPMNRAAVQSYLSHFPQEAEARQLLTRINNVDAQAHNPWITSREQALTHIAQGILLTDAQNRLDTYLKKYPHDAQAWGGLGRIYLKNTEYEHAILSFSLALRYDQFRSKEWSSMLTTARFWGLVHAARLAHASKLNLRAQQLLNTALSIIPGQEEALVQLGQLAEEAQHWQEAERYDRQVLSTNPENSRALSSLLRVLQQSGRWDDLEHLIHQYQRYTISPQNQSLLSEAHLTWLKQKSDQQETQGLPVRAIPFLEQAVALDKNDPWLRFRLAKLYLKTGQKSKAWSLMSAMVPPSATVTSSDTRFAYAIFLSNQNQTHTALTVIQPIPEGQRTPSMQKFVQRLQVEDLLQQAQQAASRHQYPMVAAQLQTARTIAAHNSDLLYSVARTASDLGHPKKGLNWLQSELKIADQNSRLVWQLDYARLLNHLGKDTELAIAMKPLIQTPQQLTDAQNSEVLQLRLALAQRQINLHRRLHDFTGAQTVLTSALQLVPDSRDLLLLEAQLDADTGKNNAARLQYLGIIQRDPSNLEARFGLFDLDWSEHHSHAARQQLSTIVGMLHNNDVDNQFAVARRYLRLGDTQAAQAILPSIDTSNPPSVTLETLLLQGQIAEARGLYAQAGDRYRQAEALQPPATAEPSQADRALASIEVRRDGYITTGFSFYDKAGSDGSSTSSVREFPTLVYLPLNYTGHLFAHMDRVDYSAGRLLPDSYSQKLFGQLFNSPASAQPYTPLESALGTAAALGYETDSYRVDLGSTPLGFPIQNRVGGIKWFGSTPNYYGSLDIARRPVDSTLLSYAGAEDPLTRQWWGGVVSTGLAFRLGHENGSVSTFVSGGLHVLKGTNVLSNNELDFSSGINHDFIVSQHYQFTTGLSFTLWRYQHNLDNFTFGQGGYYSPQSYLALNWPLRCSGEWDRWSYRISGSVGIAQASTAAIAFYPTDNQAQNQSLTHTNSLPGGFSLPVYPVSAASTSFSWNFETAFEYRVSAHWFAGSTLGLERSPYYTPNFATFYIRYELNRKSSPMTSLPRPVVPYSDY